jgi:hypothetical protein
MSENEVEYIQLIDKLRDEVFSLKCEIILFKSYQYSHYNLERIKSIDKTQI